MALIKTVEADEATGTIKQVYDLMKQVAGGNVPKPLQLLSASERIFEINWQVLQYYMQHPKLNPVLLAYIRYSAAATCEFPYCIDMNKQILMNMGGLTEEQAQAVVSDPEASNLDEKDKAMLAFVQKSLNTPEDVIQVDVDKLRAMGWADSDIFDAVNHGAMMVSGGILFNTFKMGI